MKVAVGVDLGAEITAGVAAGASGPAGTLGLAGAGRTFERAMGSAGGRDEAGLGEKGVEASWQWMLRAAGLVQSTGAAIEKSEAGDRGVMGSGDKQTASASGKEGTLQPEGGDAIPNANTAAAGGNRQASAAIEQTRQSVPVRRDAIAGGEDRGGSAKYAQSRVGAPFLTIATHGDARRMGERGSRAKVAEQTNAELATATMAGPPDARWNAPATWTAPAAVTQTPVGTKHYSATGTFDFADHAAREDFEMARIGSFTEAAATALVNTAITAPVSRDLRGGADWKGVGAVQLNATERDTGRETGRETGQDDERGSFAVSARETDTDNATVLKASTFAAGSGVEAPQDLAAAINNRSPNAADSSAEGVPKVSRDKQPVRSVGGVMDASQAPAAQASAESRVAESEHATAGMTAQAAHEDAPGTMVQVATHATVTHQAGAAMDSSVLVREQGTHSTAMGAAADASGLDRPSGASDLREAFMSLDAATSVGSPAWVHAGGQHAEAGFEDPALGWVGVRADVSGGSVHAAVMPGSAEAAQTLNPHMAGLNAYLAEQHAATTTVTLGTSGGNGMENGAGQNMQQGAGQNAERNGAPDAQMSTQTGERSDGDARSTATETLSTLADGVAMMTQTVDGSGRHISVMA